MTTILQTTSLAALLRWNSKEANNNTFKARFDVPFFVIDKWLMNVHYHARISCLTQYPPHFV